MTLRRIWTRIDVRLVTCDGNPLYRVYDFDGESEYLMFVFVGGLSGLLTTEYRTLRENQM
jgi:hypothetical protein